MHIHISTSTVELANLGMTEEQLKESVRDALINHACGPDGDRADIGSPTIEVQVLFTRQEFAQVLSPKAK